MIKYKKKYQMIWLLVLSMFLFVGCRPSEVTSYNLSKDADNFKCMRKITVYNARTDTIIFELEGNFALQNGAHNELEVVCKTDDNTYKKNYIYLNEYVIYVVEDINGTYENPYHYSVTFYGNTPDLSLEVDGITLAD